MDMLVWLRGWGGWRSSVVSSGFYTSGGLGADSSGGTWPRELGRALVLLVPMSRQRSGIPSSERGIGGRVYVRGSGD